MKNLIILGTGGNCIDILDAVLALNAIASTPSYQVRGFLDDQQKKHGKQIHGFHVVGALSEAKRFPQDSFINGIGSFHNYWLKSEIIAKTGLPLESFETIVHPRASVSRFAALGPGTAVLQNVTVNAHAKIGSHVILLPNSVISHDVVIGDYSCVASGACIAGAVRIGTACYLGANCSISNGVSMGDFSLAGIGAVVLKDVSENSVVVGNPARRIRAAR
jgi:sugar O-acyltransferase (sialic acid O-acetyltransferase NeuD family)